MEANAPRSTLRSGRAVFRTMERGSVVWGRAALPAMRNAVARGEGRNGKRNECYRDAGQYQRDAARRNELPAMRHRLADRAIRRIVERRVLVRRAVLRRLGDKAGRKFVDGRGDVRIMDVRLGQLDLRRKRQNREYCDPPPPNRMRGADLNSGMGWARLQLLTSTADSEPYNANR